MQVRMNRSVSRSGALAGDAISVSGFLDANPLVGGTHQT